MSRVRAPTWIDWRQRAPAIAAAAAVTIGILLRLREFSRNNGMIFDEAALAYNVISRPFIGLIGPLQHWQMAPVPFLWVAKLSVMTLGVSEWALRLIPLLASIGTVILFGRLAARALAPWPAALAVLLIALSTEQIHYAAIFKQYSVDVLVTTVILGLALSCYRTATLKTWWVMVIGGLVSLTVSMPSVFVLGGVGLAMIGTAFRTRDRRFIAHVLSGLAVWLAAFAAVFRQTSQDPDLKAFFQWWWNGSFLDPRLPDFPHRVSLAVSETLHAAAAGPTTPRLVIVCLLAGVVAGLAALASRRSTQLLVTLAVPPTLMAAASGLHFYPIAARFLLFLAPCVVLALAFGTEAGRPAGSMARRAWGGLLAGSALVACVPPAWQQAAAGATDETALRPLISELEARSRPPETVYLFHKIAVVYMFYSTDWNQAAGLDRARRFSELISFRTDDPIKSAQAARDGLRLTDRGRGIVIGLGDGKHYLETRGFESSEPAPDWAGGEVRRIRAEGSSTAWLLFGRANESPREDLLRQIRVAGGTIDLDLGEQGAHLYRVRFSR